jgi:hypothetical protein
MLFLRWNHSSQLNLPQIGSRLSAYGCWPYNPLIESFVESPLFPTAERGDAIFAGLAWRELVCKRYEALRSVLKAALGRSSGARP